MSGDGGGAPPWPAAEAGSPELGQQVGGAANEVRLLIEHAEPAHASVTQQAAHDFPATIVVDLEPVLGRLPANGAAAFLPREQCFVFLRCHDVIRLEVGGSFRFEVAKDS